MTMIAMNNMDVMHIERETGSAWLADRSASMALSGILWTIIDTISGEKDYSVEELIEIIDRHIAHIDGHNGYVACIPLHQRKESLRHIRGRIDSRIKTIVTCEREIRDAKRT